MESYDFIVIGSGPAGQRASIQAAKLGKRVALVERLPVIGGVALHSGTIPSKTLREAILYLTGWHQRGFYGRDYRVKDNITINDLHQRLDITISHEVDVIQEQLYRNNIEIFYGEARFASPHQIIVTGYQGKEINLKSEYFLIATGSRPRRPDSVPFDDDRIIDADGVLHISSVPSSVTVIGAGVIGIEYATMFKALDIDVTLIHERPTIMPFMDREIIGEFVHAQKDSGMNFRVGEQVTKIEVDKDKVIIHLESEKQVCSDLLIYSAGRVGCTTALKLENIGIEVNERNNLDVDDQFRTTVHHIYAAGDVIGFPALASTSMEQGRQIALHIFGGEANFEMSNIPYGIYSVPEISMVGKTEQELVKEKVKYVSGVARFRETGRGQILGLREGMLKLLIDRNTRKLLGVHIVGHSATELIHIGQTVMALEGTLDYLVNNIFNYPTLGEAYKIAALAAWNSLQS